MNWIFITAGVGSIEFEGAAKRLGNQIAEFELFSEIRIFQTSDVEKFCPELKDWYPDQNLNTMKGYGWYVWKSRFAKIALEQSPHADGIMYLDAGCESLPNYFSKKKLIQLMNHTVNNGACVFSIPTPEVNYTKKSLLNRFNLNQSDLDGFQFQSGSWLFVRDLGLQFIKEWDEIVWEDKHYCDESESGGGELPDFIVNRYDQSVFSPLVRKFGFFAYSQMPPGNIDGIKSRIRFFFFPFAWARNRSDRSVVKPFEKTFARITLKLSNIFDEIG